MLLTVFLLGPAVTALKPGRYFAAPDTWHFLENIALSHQLRLPGVFTGNPHSDAFNNSLWSLQPEMLMYCLLAGAGLLAVRTPLYAAICAVAVLIAFVLKRNEDFPYKQVFSLGAYFVAGMLLYRARALLLNYRVFAAALVAAFAAALGGLPALALWLVLPLTALLAAHARAPAFKSRVLFGDWSYGIYLYGYPVQQTLAWLGLRDFFSSLALAFLLTLGFAMLSWHFVEARALRLKPRGLAPTAARPLERPATS